MVLPEIQIRLDQSLGLQLRKYLVLGALGPYVVL